MHPMLDLDEALIARAEAEAARQGTTLARFVAEAVEMRLRRVSGEQRPEEQAPPREPFRVRVFGSDSPPMDFATFQRRVAEAEEDDDRRRAGLPNINRDGGE